MLYMLHLIIVHLEVMSVPHEVPRMRSFVQVGVFPVPHEVHCLYLRLGRGHFRCGDAFPGHWLCRTFNFEAWHHWRSMRASVITLFYLHVQQSYGRSCWAYGGAAAGFADLAGHLSSGVSEFLISNTVLLVL